MIERVVFDTSSLIGAALHFGSIPWSALSSAFERCHVFINSQTTDEFELVLSRPYFVRCIPQAAREEFLAWYRSNSRFLEMPESRALVLEPQCRDPKDNKFLALAAACQAKIIVSSDQDLLVLHPWRGIAILTPAQFLTQLSL